VVTDRTTYGPVFTRLGISNIIRRHSVRNHFERWIQRLKRYISYASFTGHEIETTKNFDIGGFIEYDYNFYI
jgi:hypothetical protein